ncbi:MAG: phosphoglyceromutase [Candidatus Pelagibacter sp. TMED273]|nr:MAG: phosphoglyceromutase [Candidatus Pelagibacter sp. TMED273]|tara:strand:- start:10952 stop:11692 length:741 start_codon:yes stop_codon:yes gene_type:complete
MKLILLRHGESEWNKLNKFTGWTDVDLTKQGIDEAAFSGQQILNEKITVDYIYTSLLKRAINTSKIVADILDFHKENIIYDWRLNERHYGALQGLNKSETAEKFGEEQVKIWRRSFSVSPPKLSLDDKRHPRFSKTFNNIEGSLPAGESLEDVIIRLKPFLKKFFSLVTKKNGSYLIVAHSNSLRAIVKILDSLSDEEIISLNIPTGIPLVYDLDKDLNVLNKKYLIDEKRLKEKEEIVINQGKMQ